jgi:hypothetical protein
MNKDNLEELRERLLREDKVQHMIRVRAYEIYRMRGPQPGAPASDWFQAESEVLSFLLANESLRLDERASEKPKESVSAAEHAEEPTARKKPKSSSSAKAPSAIQPTPAKSPSKRVVSKKTRASTTKPKRVRKKKEEEKN